MKSIFKSKTFWFQLLSVAVAVTHVVPVSAPVAAVITGVVNVILRTQTTEPVRLFGKK